MRWTVALLATVLALAGLAGCGEDGAEPGAPKGATLVLDFVPNAVHSGIYAALSRGYYDDEGVALKVQPPGESTDAPKLLGAGKVEFAILDIHDLGIARERGIDLVGVAPLVQRPLAAVLARADGPVRRPREMEGHQVGVTGLPSDEAVVDSEVEADGGDPAEVERVTIGFNAVASLAAGKVDAATGFWNAEGVALRAPGRPDPHLQGRPVRRPALPRADPDDLAGDARRRPRAGRRGRRRDRTRLRLHREGPRRGARRPARRQPRARTRRTAGPAEGRCCRSSPRSPFDPGSCGNGPPGTSSTACWKSR